MEENVRPAPAWSYTPHKRFFASDDPFFEEGELVCNIERKQLDNSEEVEDLIQKSEFLCDVTSCGEWFSSVSSYEAHYNSVHRHSCQNCQRSFPSTHLLEIHVLENHDTLFSMIATRKNLYRCLVESCPDRFSNDEERKDHLVSFHKYPADFRFNRPSRQQRKKKSNQSTEESMDTSTEPQVAESSVASPAHKARLPKTICFGRGSTKTFQRNFPKKNKKKGSKSKQGHNEVQCPSQEITMTDVS